MEKDCIFCKIAKKQVPAKFVSESTNFIAIKDANPKAEGHTLIIPKEHYVTLLDIPAKICEEMIELAKTVAKGISKGKDGFNMIMNNHPAAGQVVMHAHIHIIPRVKGDGLRMIS
jgi:histidine triad (HIT) family protein